MLQGAAHPVPNNSQLSLALQAVPTSNQLSFAWSCLLFGVGMRERDFLRCLLWFLTIQTTAHHVHAVSPKTACTESERAALLAFRASLTDSRNRLSSWEGEDCCRWRGVSCNTTTGHVMTLDLRNPQEQDTSWALSGEINPSLHALTHLKHLDLSFNDFKGRIPPHLGNLSSLHYLNLSYSFYLYADNLEWLSLLSSLKYLDMSGVNLATVTNWLYIVNGLPSLSVLRLGACSLDTFPISLPFFNLTALKSLDLSSNEFNSILPGWLWNSSSLTYLTLSRNSFYGPIPDLTWNSGSLTYLDLSENSFHGSIPGALGNSTSLEVLRLASNNLKGSVQKAFRNHTWNKLTHLDLSGNSLSGNLSGWLEEMISLTYLDLSTNLLDGQIPTGIGKLSQLEVLILTRNNLTGIITEDTFAHLTKLDSLFLSFNSFAIDVDDHWVPPFQLSALSLHSCRVGPGFPAWLRWQQQIDVLDLSDTGIIDTIPNWFWNSSSRILALSHNQISGRLPRSLEFMAVWFMNFSSNQFEGPIPRLPRAIRSLDLSNNSFSGVLPPDIGATEVELKALFLSNNHIEGSIPSFICTHFIYIDLSSNHLSGQVPRCQKESQLKVLHLDSNNLSGDISSSVGSFTSLISLSLRNNSFYGAFPLSLKNCWALIFLDLGENIFSGTIPAWVGEYFPSPIILRLGSNLFQGNIPSQLAKLQYLQVLDIAHNNISGSIPQSFGNFNAMASILMQSLNTFIFNVFDYDGIGISFHDSLQMVMYGRVYQFARELYLLRIMDLSDNNLSGEIPEQMGALSSLLILNLSGNHLTGAIPKNIGGLRLLESLDLSRNEFSGTIPLSMSTLTFLEILDLSYNNLSGKIPSGGQFPTFDPSTYVGNAELCGPPLSKICLSTIKFGNGQHNKGFETMWFYLGIGMGYMFGFGASCGVLLLKSSWRYKFFRFIDSMYNTIYVVMAIGMAKFVKKFGRSSAF